MKKKIMEITYDVAYAQLRVLVAEIEDDSLQLDALADKIKQAKELIVFCENKLRGIEKKLR